MVKQIAGSIVKMADEHEPRAKKRKISSVLSSNKEVESSTCSNQLSSLEFYNDVSDSKNPDKVGCSDDKCLSLSERKFHVENDLGKDQETNLVSKQETRSVKARSVSEEEVGILEFVRALPRFHAVLKQRYTDFIVSERDIQGNLVRLTDLSVPEAVQTVKPSLDILSADDKDRLQQVSDDNEKKLSMILTADDDKDHRRLVHLAIKANFPLLDSDTVDVDAKKAVRVFHKSGHSKQRRDKRWPADLGQYCWFVLYKENRDTMDAISFLSKLLKIKTGHFGYAGTKDRRAVTTQQVSVYRVYAEQLQQLNGTLRHMCVGNFRYCKEPLKLGSLSGNHFIITLRNVIGDYAKIDQSLDSLKTNGFINYFGLQRFGTSSVPTHKIGRALILRNWSEAVDLLLNPRDFEANDLSVACKHWKDTRDAKETLKRMPKQGCIENTLLQGLVKYGPKDLVNALHCIPRNTRLMYVHAYQSYVWNHVVSKRIKEYGFQPMKGDLVAMTSSAACSESAGMSNQEEIPSVEFLPEPSRSKVLALTEDDIKSGHYTIRDVVLPLPGYGVVYPDNEIKGYYKQLLADDGLDINNMRSKVRDYSLSGAYRKLIVKPSVMSWRWLQYNDVKEPLVQTDMDRLQGSAKPQSVPDGKYLALQVEFTLPSSTYATMALREILRCGTSAAYQSTLNQDLD